MRQIVVLSGKGGAGKTSITASLVKMLDQAVAVDADVNASNLPLLLNHRRQGSQPYYGMDIARIEADQCTACGECLAACRFDAIVENPAGAPAITGDCEGCALCTFVCPTRAIGMTDRQSGEWYVSTLDNGYLVHADLVPGEDNSGKLITRIRREATAVAKDKNISYIITDGPPGTSCQAISSMTGNDLVLAVVEESLSGLSDYRRLAELVRKFSLPHLVLINKAGFNEDIDQQIIQSVNEYGGRLAGRIAFDPRVPEALQQLRTFADLESHQDFFKTLVARILEDP